MSALAARRAALAAQSGASVAQAPPHTSAVGNETGTRDSRSSSSPDSTSEDEDDTEAVALLDETQAGPSTASQKPRYYAAQPHGASSPPQAPASKTLKRKRAFSPSAPMGSESGSESEAVGGGSSDGSSRGSVEPIAVQDEQQRREIPLNRTPGASRHVSRGPHGAVPARLVTSTFIARRGVNVEVLSRDLLRRAGFANASASGVLVSLAASETLTLYGIMRFTVFQGSISICSVTMTPSPGGAPVSHPIFAPTTHPLPAFTTCAPSELLATSPILARIPLPPTFARDSSKTLLLLEEHQVGLGGMRGGAVPPFAGAWPEGKGWFGLRGVHLAPNHAATAWAAHSTPHSWSTASSSLVPAAPNPHSTSRSASLARSQDAPILLVKGPKDSGKSTVARAALNTLLTDFEQVAWLECDLGQSEFGCGGVIGIWVLDQPVFAHFLGHYTPLSCPHEYLAAIENLVEYYHSEIRLRRRHASQRFNTPLANQRRSDVVPLVINTQGWVKGLGEELLQSIEQIVRASHVFTFPSPAEAVPEVDKPGWTSSPTLPAIGLPPTMDGADPVTFELDAAPASQQRLSAADHRELATLAYFYSRLPPSLYPADMSDPASSVAGGTGVKWDFSRPLVAGPPYEVAVGPDSPIKAIFMIGEAADGILPADLALALNASLVALLQVTPGALTDGDGEPVEPYIQNRPLPVFGDANFLGYAIIRAVSLASSGENGGDSATVGGAGMTLHILTPMPADELERVNAIVRNGAMELPTPGMLDWAASNGSRRGGAGSGRRDEEDGVAGTPWRDVPFFDLATGGVGIERRQIRKGLPRRGV